MDRKPKFEATKHEVLTPPGRFWGIVIWIVLATIAILAWLSRYL